jgi:hypothetical protein
MMAMEDRHPDNVMTDQDQAMATAIDANFPALVRRCCVYHVLNIAKRKLGPLLIDGHPFSDAFYSCIYGTNTIEEFGIRWQHMLRVHPMADNTHLQNIWKTRMTWSPVYFRHIFSHHIHNRQIRRSQLLLQNLGSSEELGLYLCAAL